MLKRSGRKSVHKSRHLKYRARPIARSEDRRDILLKALTASAIFLQSVGSLHKSNGLYGDENRRSTGSPTCKSKGTGSAVAGRTPPGPVT